MIQKILIEVESSKPLKDYGDGHIILFDKMNDRYYVTTRESFLKTQNDKLAEMEKEQAQAIQDINNYKNEMDAKFLEFLKKYQETNATMINMIKSLKGD